MAKVIIELDLQTEMQEARDIFKLLTDSGAVAGEFLQVPLLDLNAAVPTPAPEQITPVLNVPAPPDSTAGNPFAGLPATATPPEPEPTKHEGHTPIKPTPAPTATDSEGLPWDARIHAGARTKRQSDMTWKLKRNVDETLVKQVKAELRGAAAMPVTETIYAGDPVVAPDGGPAAAIPFGLASHPVGCTCGCAVAVPPAPPTLALDYVTLVQMITSKQHAGELAVTDVTAACDVIGIITASDLSDKPELIPAFAAQLGLTC